MPFKSALRYGDPPDQWGNTASHYHENLKCITPNAAARLERAQTLRWLPAARQELDRLMLNAIKRNREDPRISPERGGFYSPSERIPYPAGSYNAGKYYYRDIHNDTVGIQRRAMNNAIAEYTRVGKLGQDYHRRRGGDYLVLTPERAAAKRTRAAEMAVARVRRQEYAAWEQQILHLLQDAGCPSVAPSTYNEEELRWGFGVDRNTLQTWILDRLHIQYPPQPQPE